MSACVLTSVKVKYVHKQDLFIVETSQLITLKHKLISYLKLVETYFTIFACTLQQSHALTLQLLDQ